MRLEMLPLLATQRELVEMPRGWERFGRYLRLTTGDTDATALPRSVYAFNPAGRVHVARVLDRLRQLNAEGIVAEELSRAGERLTGVDYALRVGLVVADDKRGGWTNRYFSEMSQRFELNAMRKRHFAVVICWSSEFPTEGDIRRETRATVYRHAYQLTRGEPRCLGEYLEQDGEAAVFAGEDAPAAPAPSVRECLERHRASTHYPTIFACLFGDEAAISVGYPPVGLPARAGFGLARFDAHAAGRLSVP